MFGRYHSLERRRGPLFYGGVILVAYLVTSWAARLWTDYLWFESVGQTHVWVVRVGMKAAVGAAGFLIVFLFVWVNLMVADRLSPRYGSFDFAVDDEMVERFRRWSEPYGRRLWVGMALILALLLGAGMSAWSDRFLLAANAVSFGVTDPQFGLDLSFFVFALPVWSLLVSFLTNLVIFTGLLVVAVHVLNGSARFAAGGRPAVRSGVKTQLSILAALFMVLRALSYRVDSFELLFNRNQGFYGAGFADITARLPALRLLELVALVASGLLLWNIRRPGWTLAWVSLGGWLAVSLLGLFAYPAVVQRFRVDNDPFARERPFIERNIAFTRAAYDLTDVEVRPWEPQPVLTLDDITAHATTFDNLRLWDPDVLTRTYRKNQEIRPYYRIDQVDTDRYTVEGRPLQTMIAVRELEDDNPDLPNDWQNRRLIYTHGFGAVLNAAAVVAVDGQPEFIVKDIPPVSTLEELTIEQPRVYFGETYDPDRPLVVKTGSRPQEIDFPLAQGSAENEYGGAGGVRISSMLHKAAFALRYRDLNLLISPQVRDDSRMLMHRNIRTIVDQVAPFLAADSDPYPVVVNGRLVWVIDMYTTSGFYPYSEPIDAVGLDTRRMRRASGLPGVGGFNYIRNSVKAVIDAYDGTMRFYIVDPSDPIVGAWARIHPGLFAGEEPPADLRSHFRYPQDLFTLQSEIYRDYHMDKSLEFFQRVDPWQITEDPSTILRRPHEALWGDIPEGGGSAKLTYLPESLPTYLLLRLPGEEDASYALSQSFKPSGKINMASILIADSTDGRYGRLIDYRFGRGSAVEGAGQVGERIEQDSEIGQQFTLWRGQGSDVVLGDMLVLPIDQSIMYVQPVFLAAESGGLPEFRRVIVVYGDQIEWAPSLDEALGLVFGTEVGRTDTASDVEGLLAAAAAAFERAEAALKQGDLAGYQRLVNEAESLITQALDLLASTPDG